ncbi:MAG: twitching motility protein PilT [Nitrospirae bacterium RIFCSPLOWO2_02_FULL_62_14]|nr:MAG: twitching motility protein PilT [Nitrospirae bacterium RIFCSPLOWO2_02_FULL_62_14]
MRLLLDTSTFLWWITDSDRLSKKGRDLLAGGRHDVWFSAVSSWEIVIKAALGRVTLPRDSEHFIAEQISINAFQVLPIHLKHTLKVASLPSLHRDPFDRLLIAQALSEDFTILSGDSQVAAYPVPVVW